MIGIYQIDTSGITEVSPNSSLGIKVQKRMERKTAVEARLDSTAMNRHNSRYWSNAERGLTYQVLDQHTREIARDRCRYEYLNNVVMFGGGLMKTAFNIGRGPQLQLGIKGQADWNRHLEEEFRYWCEDVRWNKNLRLAPKTMLYDGEFILRFKKNPRIQPTMLDIEVMDARLLKTPFEFIGDENIYDGIEYDNYGNPINYFFKKLKKNPTFITYEYEVIPANQVIHFFDWIVPQQDRGLPEGQTGIPQLAMGRRLNKSVLTISELVARSGMVLETDLPPEKEADDIDMFDTFELEDGMILTMPSGWKLSQPRNPQFAIDLNESNKIINNQFGMALAMPNNVINNDSSDYNMSSARLDRTSAGVCSEIRQDDLALEVLSATYNRWHAVQANYDKIAWNAMKECRQIRRIPRNWRFPEWPSIDPLKDANAKRVLIDLGVHLLEDEILARGGDPEEHFRKLKEEMPIRKMLGIAKQGKTKDGTDSYEQSSEHEKEE